MNPFLTAEWRNLIMMNFVIEPQILDPYLPNGTELDLFDDQCFVSIVGFQFLNTKVKGLPIPFHRHFEEVNLRFYVKPYQHPEKRGVVFIKEIVPRMAIAKMARWLYNEPYISMPMDHFVSNQKIEYSWGKEGRVSCTFSGTPNHLKAASLEEFIAEHYWGFTAQKDGGTKAYEVQHPPWRVWKVHQYSLSCDFQTLYGDPFVDTLSAEPHSVFLAEGSKVSVFPGLKLDLNS